MTRKDIDVKVASETVASIELVDKCVEKIISTVSDALINREYVVLKGLGVFKIHHAAPRKGRNLNTGEMVDIPAYDRVVFTPSKQIKLGLKQKK